MTLSQLSDIAQIIAAIMVVPSLIFVGLQMRQNTRAVRASMSQAHANGYHEIMGRLFDSEELAKLYMKGASHPEQLDTTESARFILMVAIQFRFFDASYAQYRDGQLSEMHWRSLEKIILGSFGSPGHLLWWERRKNTLSEAFRTWFESQDPVSFEHVFKPFNADTDKEADTA
jgi:hypothetical protein